MKYKCYYTINNDIMGQGVSIMCKKCDKEKFYITTAIAYTSRKPHIGNS